MITKNGKTRNRFSIALGFALFLQAITSLVSGTLFLSPFSDKSDIARVMLDTASNQPIAHFSIFLDIITAFVIVWLGVLFFSLVRKANQVWATTALAFYIVEAGILIISKFLGYALIQASVSYSVSNDKALETIGQILLSVKDFTYSIHIIPFGISAIIFYYLLYKTKALPSWLSLWGLITVIPVLLGSILNTYGVDIPFILMIPYVPFEFFAGLYILIRGLPDNTVVER